MRREARLGRVVPASPVNTNSESWSSAQSAAEVVNPANGLLRRPSSYPVVRTSGLTRLAAAPVAGSTVMVVPRASLL